MKLIPFEEQYIPILTNWMKDEDTLLKFAGIAFQYPLTREQMLSYIQKHPERLIYLGIDDENQPIAYGEVIPQENESARLGHLLIGESQNRGKGLGKQLITLLINEAKLELGIKRIDLYLLSNNEVAAQCYLKYGFHFIDNDFSITYKNQSYPILKMTMTL
ncbi:GNAT family N-acetyltransferase [Pedobacter aquae]|uniref:GNAT family N-acetyltransferase n=1 Tax=Pedobacter aquae TaxID=2605747 RepID=A0A5C0VJJ7_9SPHI|nr:GNAT family N-acetyltransferase [Pedobacter aquae]QEK51174.1 GNAT family N-acetyltransferase [Pedobacter aquae]